MPPQKGAASAKSQPETKQQNGQVKSEKTQRTEPQSKKRTKKDNDEGPNKAQRRSGRGQTTSPPQLIKFMLTKAAQELCRPNDESELLQDRKNMRTYSSGVLNPFEELLCSVVLSRPISHRLGLRTIRTILNEPYEFTSAQAIKSAGENKVHEAVWEAKTQHKQKTAEEIFHVADVVLEKFTGKGDSNGEQLGNVLQADDVDGSLDTLKDSIKGLGPTALNIFRRRVQWLWPGAYPFIDDRTSQSLKKLGLPQMASQLEKLLDENWSDLDTKSLEGADEAAKKRRAFVVVLERAIGADLEGKIESLVEAARG